MTARHAMIAGTGLIGASLGMALRAAGWRVTGWDPDATTLSLAAEMGAIDATATGLLVDDVDILVLAGPTPATIATLSDLVTDVLVTDVSAVKTPVLEAAAHLPHFVGGHPMAGRAGSGVQMATPNLFRGAAWILAANRPDDLERVKTLVEAVGARPIPMTAADHDRAIALISHLPHVVAASLVELASSDDAALELVAGSFRDLTRVAGSDASAWTDILASNATEIGTAVAALEERLARWRAALSEGRTDAISEALRASQRTRSTMTPDVTRVVVPLVDEPGELARVGKALERSGADVRDMQLRHGEHGGGGLLTLTVLPRDEEPLRERLRAEGFQPD